MDRTAIARGILQKIHRYRYALLVLLLGLVLVALPTNSTKEEPETPSETLSEAPSPKTLTRELEEILSQVQGAGQVRVLLTEAAGAQTLYQTDENVTSDTRKQDTVVVTDENRSQTGLPVQVLPPTYQGAVVVCQGGDDPVVRLAIIQTVSKLTGLGSDRISVLKMK